MTTPCRQPSRAMRHRPITDRRAGDQQAANRPRAEANVLDNGIGIAPEQLGHLFELFAQFDVADKISE